MNEKFSDQELLRLYFEEGERSAFSDFYDRYKDQLTFYLVAILGDQETVFEVMQELYLDICRNPGRFMKARHMKAYLFGAVYKLSRQWLRKKKRRAETMERALEKRIAFTPDEDAALYGGEAADRLGEAIMRLPEALRHVLVLHVYEGLTFREMQDVTCVKQKTLFSRYQLALEKLQFLIKDINL